LLSYDGVFPALPIVSYRSEVGVHFRSQDGIALEGCAGKMREVREGFHKGEMRNEKLDQVQHEKRNGFAFARGFIY
jgi:hypothetical protein